MSWHTRVISLGAPGIFAAPAGGPFGGRGCTLLIALSTTLFMALGAANASAEEPVEVPSGLDVVFHDWLDDQGAHRFRFIAPEIGQGGKQFDDVVDDMAHLCDQFVLPQLEIQELQASQVVISLMAEPVDFGEMAPGVTQFFESYSVENGLCIWELF